MTKLPVGVIGVGHLGSLHTKMYAEIESANLVGVYDVDPSRAEQVAQHYHTKAFPSMNELLKNCKAVSIATTTKTHYEVAQQAINAGVHVLIEKPITRTVDEAEALIKLAKEKKVKIQVGHIERFNPALLALEKYHLQPMFIESHRLAQFNPRGTDVAVVLDLMIHDIDIIMSLVNSDVEQIHANGVAVVSDNVDIANARIQFTNGCVANVTASRISQKKMRKMRMFQRDAYISVDFSDGHAEVFRLDDGTDTSSGMAMMLGEITRGSVKRHITYERPEIKDVNALKFELEQFIDAVLNDHEPVVTGEEGKRALQLAHDIIKKIEQQNIVL